MRVNYFTHRISVRADWTNRTRGTIRTSEALQWKIKKISLFVIIIVQFSLNFKAVVRFSALCEKSNTTSQAFKVHMVMLGCVMF